VPPQSSNYFKAQYYAAVAEYELGQVDASLARHRKLSIELAQSGKDKNLLGLVQINMGRVAFQKGKFKDSLDAFQKVPKEHPLWIPALQEQAWAQLQSKDAFGAIGNMHSIQSPYFDGVFKPETYVVRTIGYLGICQYGDADKTLGYLEYRYQPWLERLNAFNKTATAAKAYDVVFKHVQNFKSKADVDGLPYQVIREATRQKDYLNLQENMNQLIDENGGYAFIKNLIESDIRKFNARKTGALQKIAQLRQKVKTAAVTPGAMKNINAWKQELAGYEELLDTTEFKISTSKEGLKGFEKLTTQGQARVAEFRADLKNQAGRTLKDHFAKMSKDLKQVLENDELLRYEIYAGSGENLRSQVAGAKPGAVKRGERKPSGQNWDFEGEFWEDEIGNYRSSLKNNCRGTEGVAQRQQ
jgi:hypothetical protein